MRKSKIKNTNESEVKKVLKEANKLIKESQFKELVQLLQPFEKEDGNPRILFALAYGYYFSFEIDDAIRVIGSIENEYDTWISNLILGVRERKSKNYPKAITHLEKSIRLNPTRVEPVRELFETNYEDENHHQAIKWLKVLINQFEDYQYLYRLMELAIVTDNEELAVNCLEAKMKLDLFSTVVVGFTNLIEHYFKLEDSTIKKLKKRMKEDLGPDLSFEFNQMIDDIEEARSKLASVST